jgi:hypothetical protein
LFKLFLLSAEHIGTKTAVQIRSHAQKFFNKLEKKKEAGQQPDKGRHSTVFKLSTILSAHLSSCGIWVFVIGPKPAVLLSQQHTQCAVGCSHMYYTQCLL